ncbi:MAG: glutamine--fructose-6-phosphate transaminase (isomerizing) [Thermodesulfobacteriota bacterium]
MCGIVGYIGNPERTIDVLFNGLKSLEYRGYDSSGICVLNGDNADVIRSEGKLNNLKLKLDKKAISGKTGIGHTRWATHGKPTEKNAHPHVSGPISIVHNGIIENFSELKKELKSKGHKFNSDTDTEVVAHLIEDFINRGSSFETSVKKAFSKVEGSYAAAILYDNEPEKIIAIRKFSPLVIAENKKEKFLASDIPAILPHTNKIIFLEDGDFAVITPESVDITDVNGKRVKRNPKVIDWDPVMVEKAGYKHFMLKEIHEQPRALLDTIRGRFDETLTSINFDELKKLNLNTISKILILGCGTSYHASLIGKYIIESFARIPVEVDLASEFRYRDHIVDKNTLVISVSQSGETADTSEALLAAKEKGAKTLGITNVEMSKIARESQCSIYTKAGPEIGVASTKAFTTQIISLYMLAVYLGVELNSLKKSDVKKIIKDIIAIPNIQQSALDLDEQIKVLAKEFYKYKNFIYLGRGVNYPVALEGALKLKEISYIHAEGYAAGEMKHGPIALIDENMPVVVIAPKDGIYFQKILGNFQEIKARGGRIIIITSDKSLVDLIDKDDRAVMIPKCSELLSPLITVVPLQFLAYHIANTLGTDIDQPRNLAKVVTVE